MLTLFISAAIALIMGNKIVFTQCFDSKFRTGKGVSGGFNVLSLFQDSLEQKGFTCIAKTGTNPCVKSMVQSDFVVFCGDAQGVSATYDLVRALNKKYIFLPFYEEKHWLCYASQFVYDTTLFLQGKFFLPNDIMFVQQQRALKLLRLSHKPIFEDSLFNIVNSNHEAYEILKEYSQVKLGKCRLACGIVRHASYEYSNRFLKLIGLEKGEYVLQIGRLNLRKNQLSSILGTNNLSYPLVFIFSEFTPEYVALLLKAIDLCPVNKAIYFVTSIKGLDFGDRVKVIQSKLDDALIISAYQNAGLHLHPAFYECPGYTYLEAAKLGIPTVASSWSTVREYLSDEGGDFAFEEGIEFVRPDSIEQIEYATKKMFGKKFLRPELPIFSRTDDDVKKDMGALIDRYMI